MKKILLSIAVLGLVGGLVGGATWAYFADSASAEGISAASGNADLTIYGYGVSSDYEDNFVADIEWDNVYPGWSDSFEVKLMNESASPVGLDIVPRLEREAGSDNKLQDVITLQFISDDKETDAYTLKEWKENEKVLEHIAHNTRGEKWTLKFEFPETGENQNDLQNSGDFNFDVIFDGTQAETPITVGEGGDYDTLHDAIDAAGEGDTIKFVSDIDYTTSDEDANFSILNDGVVLDGNGYTLNYEGIGGGRTVIEAVGNGVVIKNLTLANQITDKQPYDLKATGEEVTLKQNTITRGTEQGNVAIVIGPNAIGSIVTNNHIDYGAIAADTHDCEIKDNTMEWVISEGIWMHPTPYTTTEAQDRADELDDDNDIQDWDNEGNDSHRVKVKSSNGTWKYSDDS